MKNLGRDVSTFSTLITNNYVYVDKTEHIYNLFATGDRYHFISRPRRFGKSLLISTLRELFLGNKELFNNLWIGSSDYPWNCYPVIHLDFSGIAHATPQDLQRNLNHHLLVTAQQYGITLDETERAPEEKFEELIIKLSSTNKVVVLIDEYNYPLISHLGSIHLAQEYETILKNFYGILKGLDFYLHAVFIVGVSKFSKSSIFSGINNIVDIGMSPIASTLLGFTQEEIKYYFNEHIKQFATQKNKTETEILHDMKLYNGYQFSATKTHLYNPYAVLYYLKEQELRNYWYESGVPLLLVNLLYKQLESLDAIGKIEFDAQTLDVFDSNNIPLITLLFQTGYLTIKNYNAQTNKFILNYPNDYIAHAFKQNVIEALAHTNAIIVEQALVLIKKSFINNDLNQLCQALQTLFAYIPLKLPTDPVSYFYFIFKNLFSLLSADIKNVVSHEKNYISCAIETYHFLYNAKVFFNTKAPLDASLRPSKPFCDSKKEIIFILLCTQTAEGIKVEYKIHT